LPPGIDINDIIIINSGVLGLMDAIEKFDEKKGVKFQT
jgi:DNA-directed RNA polymerase sigma subunit (sigma70/sigma32)